VHWLHAVHSPSWQAEPVQEVQRAEVRMAGDEQGREERRVRRVAIREVR